jgi:hypothetical protein
MAAAKLSDAAFLAILQAHPGLRDRLVSIALAVMNAEGNLKEADAIEERLVAAAVGAGGDAGLGRKRGRGDGARSSSTTWDASPR